MTRSMRSFAAAISRRIAANPPFSSIRPYSLVLASVAFRESGTGVPHRCSRRLALPQDKSSVSDLAFAEVTPASCGSALREPIRCLLINWFWVRIPGGALPGLMRRDTRFQSSDTATTPSNRTGGQRWI
jgi:hypothetical protein